MWTSINKCANSYVNFQKSNFFLNTYWLGRPKPSQARRVFSQWVPLSNGAEAGIYNRVACRDGIKKLQGSIYIPTVNDSIEAITIKTKSEIILFRKNLLVAIKYKSC